MFEDFLAKSGNDDGDYNVLHLKVQSMIEAKNETSLHLRDTLWQQNISTQRIL